MRWLRCLLWANDCPMPGPPARPHEPAIHEARNARQVIRSNAQAATRLAERERSEADTGAQVARDGGDIAGLMLRARDFGGAEGGR